MTSSSSVPNRAPGTTPSWDRWVHNPVHVPASSWELLWKDSSEGFGRVRKGQSLNPHSFHSIILPDALSHWWWLVPPPEGIYYYVPALLGSCTWHSEILLIQRDRVHLGFYMDPRWVYKDMRGTADPENDHQWSPAGLLHFLHFIPDFNNPTTSFSLWLKSANTMQSLFCSRISL